MTENNKVVYNGQTLIDLTQDDVTASDVRSGVYFHDSAGVRGQGTLTSTSVPTADTIAEFDSDSHMNSEDMTSQEVSDFVGSLSLVQQQSYDAWVSIMKTNFTGDNTATKVTGTTIISGGHKDDFFTIGTDQITIKKAGYYKVTLCFVLSAMTTQTNVKRIALYNNSAESCNTLGRMYAWESCTGYAIKSYAVNDVLTMYCRAEDGNSTYSYAYIMIEPLP